MTFSDVFPWNSGMPTVSSIPAGLDLDAPYRRAAYIVNESGIAVEMVTVQTTEETDQELESEALMLFHACDCVFHPSDKGVAGIEVGFYDPAVAVAF